MAIIVPPFEWTTMAIAIYDGRLDDAAVALLAHAANTIAAKENNLPHVEAPAQTQARRPARQHQRP